MIHLLYNINTLHIVAEFDTERGAKISWSRKHNKDSDLAVADIETFNTSIDYEIEVKNLLSGLPCKIKKSQQGGCCDPSTERYHSM